MQEPYCWAADRASGKGKDCSTRGRPLPTILHDLHSTGLIPCSPICYFPLKARRWRNGSWYLVVTLVWSSLGLDRLCWVPPASFSPRFSHALWFFLFPIIIVICCQDTGPFDRNISFHISYPCSSKGDSFARASWTGEQGNRKLSCWQGLLRQPKAEKFHLRFKRAWWPRLRRGSLFALLWVWI